MTGRTVYVAQMESIPGWLHPLDAGLFCTISDHQGTRGVSGDIVEIGVFHGRSAILLGFLTRAGERLIACDTFSATGQISDENALWNTRFYPELTREAFQANYLRYHPDLPVLAEIPSARLRTVAEAESCRLIHVDGAHDFATVRADALLARELCAPGGVVVFDDYCKAHLPGTAMAVWEQVLCFGLIPVALTDAKLYACWSAPHAVALRECLKDHAVRSGVRTDEHRLADRTVLRLVPRPAPAAWTESGSRAARSLA